MGAILLLLLLDLFARLYVRFLDHSSPLKRDEGGGEYGDGASGRDGRLSLSLLVSLVRYKALCRENDGVRRLAAAALAAAGVVLIAAGKMGNCTGAGGPC